MRDWRAEALGDDAPDRPTLIRTGPGDAVQAWTGNLLAIRLAMRLGVRSTVRLLGAIGALRRGTEVPGDGEGMDRGQFLRLVVAGAAAVTLGSALPAAAAESRGPSPAREWALANRSRLPKDLATFAQHDLSYRRAIFAESSPATRSSLWLEHIRGFREAHSGLTPAQVEVLDRTETIAGDESNFVGPVSGRLHRELESLRHDSITAYGLDEAKTLLATLGPVSEQVAAAGCECNCTLSDWCGSGCDCCGLHCGMCVRCACTSRGCGDLWIYECNGTC